MRTFSKSSLAGLGAAFASVAGLAVTTVGTVPADAAARQTAPSCGATVAKSTGGTWTCTFADEFSGSKVDATKWLNLTTAASGFSNGGECNTGSANNASVANGVLRLTVRKEPAPFTCKAPSKTWTTQYTGATLTTYTKFSQTYGRYEIRAKFPATTVAGLQSALWLWPVNALKYGAYPASGEIDIAEWYSKYADRAIPFIHYLSSIVDPNVTNNYCVLSDPTAFHTYTLEWTTTTMTIGYDGQTCIKDTWSPLGLVAPKPFDQPFFVNLTAALGQSTNALTSTTQVPATTQIDYVRVWK